MKEEGSYTLENLSVFDRVSLSNVKFEYTAHNFLHYFLSHIILRGIDAALPEIFYIWDCNSRIMYTIIYNSIYCYCDTVSGKDLKQIKCVCARDGRVPFFTSFVHHSRSGLILFLFLIIQKSWRCLFSKYCSFSIYFSYFPPEQLFSKVVCKIIHLIKLFFELKKRSFFQKFVGKIVCLV